MEKKIKETRKEKVARIYAKRQAEWKAARDKDPIYQALNKMAQSYYAKSEKCYAITPDMDEEEREEAKTALSHDKERLFNHIDRAISLYDIWQDDMKHLCNDGELWFGDHWVELDAPLDVDTAEMLYAYIEADDNGDDHYEVERTNWRGAIVI